MRDFIFLRVQQLEASTAVIKELFGKEQGQGFFLPQGR